MDSEIVRLLRQLMNKTAFVNGSPTSESYVNTTDSLEALADKLGVSQGANISADILADRNLIREILQWQFASTASP